MTTYIAPFYKSLKTIFLGGGGRIDFIPFAIPRYHSYVYYFFYLLSTPDTENQVGQRCYKIEFIRPLIRLIQFISNRINARMIRTIVFRDSRIRANRRIIIKFHSETEVKLSKSINLIVGKMYGKCVVDANESVFHTLKSAYATVNKIKRIDLSIHHPLLSSHISSFEKGRKKPIELLLRLCYEDLLSNELPNNISNLSYSSNIIASVHYYCLFYHSRLGCSLS